MFGQLISVNKGVKALPHTSSHHPAPRSVKKFGMECSDSNWCGVIGDGENVWNIVRSIAACIVHRAVVRGRAGWFAMRLGGACLYWAVHGVAAWCIAVPDGNAQCKVVSRGAEPCAECSVVLAMRHGAKSCGMPLAGVRWCRVMWDDVSCKQFVTLLNSSSRSHSQSCHFAPY